MATVRLHHDGWLALPETERRKLGVTTGDRLELELVGGTLTLRPARRTAAGRVAPEPRTAIEQPLETAPVVKRGPGRPRKVPAGTALPPGPEARGRRAPASAA